jgi:dipeptidase E
VRATRAQPEPVRPDRRLILALGGHEFTRRRGNEAIVEYLLTLAPPEPRVCLLPTASGDAEDQIRAFRGTLGDRAGEVSHVSLFRLEHEVVRLREHLLAQDLIYVGGGSLVNLLAVWRAHGIDEILLEAWRNGTILCGQSAGAMCWFESGISRSAGGAALVDGLGVVPGVLCVHYHRDADRREALLASAWGQGLAGYGVDDGAGLVIRGNRVSGAISAHDGAGAWRVERGPTGAAREVALEPMTLPSPRPAIDELPSEVVELRAVRASRAGVRAAGPSTRRWAPRVRPD